MIGRSGGGGGEENGRRCFQYTCRQPEEESTFEQRTCANDPRKRRDLECNLVVDALAERGKRHLASRHSWLHDILAGEAGTGGKYYVRGGLRRGKIFNFSGVSGTRVPPTAVRFVMTLRAQDSLMRERGRTKRTRRWRYATGDRSVCNEETCARVTRRGGREVLGDGGPPNSASERRTY